MSKPFAAQRDEFIIIANSFFDDVMPKLSGNEFKVLSFIIRKTRGWQKDRDRISASQMIKGTGIKSTNTVIEAAECLVELGYIMAERQNGVPTTYILNLDYEIPYQNLTTTLSKFDEVPYQNLTTQKNTKNKSTTSADAPKHAPETAHDKFAIPSEDRTRRMIANAKVSDETIRQTMLDFHALFPDITYQATQWKAGAKTLRDSYGGDLALLKAGADLARKADKLPSYPGGLVWAVDRAKAAHRVLCEATTVDESVDAQGNAVYKVQS